MKTHDLRVFFEQISLALCRYKRALCGKTVSIFSSPTLSEAPAQIWIFFEVTFPYFLSQPFLFSTLEFYGKRQGGDLLGNTKRLPRSPFPRDRLSSVVCKKEEVLKSASI